MVQTDSQARYLAYKLSHDSKYGSVDKLIPIYLKSGIDIYPHQVAAAYFAVANPLSRGYILCDEVGLGKATEAMLVISQYFYSGKDKIIVVVPTLLVKQWQRIIAEQFDLPCKIIESNTDIITDSTVKIISYPKANELHKELSTVKWDLAVFEEAHRLRKFYTGENQTASNLYNAFQNVQKLLLTATPMQINVMDLYGLIKFIDNSVFGDEQSFYKRYYKKPQNYQELKDIIAPFAFRTLRNQVRGDVKLPDRILHTQEYKLTEQENKLLQMLTQYTGKGNKIAFPQMDEYELNLMLCKLFSSSIYALSKTLSGIYFRLTKNATQQALAEAEQIKAMLDLATSITDTSKCNALLVALKQGFANLKSKGKPKAIIFTENRQTQEYLYKQLALHTNYKVVVFNNEDSITEWQKSANILLATDNASESFNMQFCSFVINYDLPWNIQKIEQRIGRCQRIGQNNDVYVLSFINRENFADVRLYELMYKRTTMFDGILGASDFVMSDVLDGEIKNTTAEMLSATRTQEQIQQDFETIQQTYKQQLDQRKEDSDQLLFNTFDESVLQKTKCGIESVVDF